MANSLKISKAGSKRKTSHSSFPRKRTKVKHVSDLPWRTVSHDFEAGVDIDEGILELEEVDGVEVEYEATEGGRVARFKASCMPYFAPLL